MTERNPFHTPIKVRLYELDILGHVNHAVYHSYAEVARMDAFEEASGGSTALRDQNLEMILLASQISYRREIRRGETVEVTADVKFGGGKTFQIEQNISKEDGTLSADLVVTVGVLDLEHRRLIADPRGFFDRAGYDLKLLSTSE